MYDKLLKEMMKVAEDGTEGQAAALSGGHNQNIKPESSTKQVPVGSDKVVVVKKAPVQPQDNAHG